LGPREIEAPARPRLSELQHLIGKRLPDMELAATKGPPVNPGKLAGTTVLFCYPYTGRPGVPDPPGWDEIPGAHGSTPQAIAYSEAYGRFRTLNVNIYGLSFQNSTWQREFSLRCNIAFTLLSDESRIFAQALDLPCFSAGTECYLKRLTLIAENAEIVHVRFPVAEPETDAYQVLQWL
jgi:peroxiredoxin